MTVPEGSRLISFDPAAHHAAWAAFEDGKLRRCGLERDTDGELWSLLETRFRGVQAQIVIELPQVYGKRDERDPNDLIPVAITVGRIASAFGSPGVKAELVRPHDWKGSVPKPIMLARIEKRLDEEEIGVLHTAKAPASLRHNIVDAVGLGLFKLGRLR